MSYMLQGSLLELLQHPHFDTALLESLKDYNETGLGCVCVGGGGGGGGLEIRVRSIYEHARH